MDMKMKPSESSLGRKSSPTGAESKAGRCFWRGVLQLNPSAMVAIGGFFRSGERTLTNEWPSCLEIKGRVRLDAFEKFIQELPMSRSRAVMVAHFVLEEGSSDEDRANLTEVVHSYVLDERLGFAEPAPGVEIYFCPLHQKLFELLGKHLPKDHTDTLNSIDNGLIGIVVWRKAQLTSAISPNSSSHHKHGSKRQQHFSSSRRMQERDLNANVNISSKQNLPSPTPVIRTQPPPPIDDDDDDIPPGFGPAPAREDDDLPEFNFSGAPSRPLPKFPRQASLRGPMVPRQVDQVRELIQKYGNSGSNSPSTRGLGIGTQPWNDEEDDDIPEWQPQASQMQKHHHHSSQPPLHNYRQPLQSHVMGQLPRVGPGGGAEEEHLKAITDIPTKSRSQEGMFKEPETKLQRSGTFPPSNAKETLKLELDTEASLEKLIKNGWWTRSNSAFLNEPPVIQSDGPAYKYASQYHVANIATSNPHTRAGISA